MRRGYIDTSVGQIHYHEAGQGPALLVICQSRRSSRMYLGLAALLSDRFRVVAPDLLGTGASDPPKPGMEVAGHAAYLVELLDGLRIEQAAVLGLHFGNKVAAAMAANAPGRVSSLIFAGQSHSIVMDAERRKKQIMEVARAYIQTGADGEREALVRWGQLLGLIGRLWFSPQMIGQGIAEAHDSFAMRRVLDELQGLSSTTGLYEAIFRQDLAADLSRVLAPTLVLEIATAREDATVGRQGQNVIALLKQPHLTTITIPDPDDAVTLEDRPGLLAEPIAEFLLGAAAPNSSS